MINDSNKLLNDLKECNEDINQVSGGKLEKLFEKKKEFLPEMEYVLNEMDHIIRFACMINTNLIRKKEKKMYKND